MEAIKFDANELKLQYGKVPIPKITEPNHVIVKVSHAGICGTDLHIIAGEFLSNKTRAVTLGHEFSGVVQEIGNGVTGFQVGDKVSVDPNNGCLCCDFCHRGDPHFCSRGGINNTVGIFKDGGWAQYVLVPEDQIFKLPESITLEQAALCEPFSCVAHGWDLASPLNVGKKILVIGAGIIGNLWASTLHLHGHRRVTVSEPNKSRLDQLKQLDLGFTLVTPDQLNKNKEKDSSYNFDIVIDCSGFAPALEQGISLLNKGGKLIIFGVSPPHAKIQVSPFEMYIKELSIIAVIINPFSFPNAIGIIEAMGDRYLDYKKLGIRVFKLSEYQEAIDILKKGTIAKAVFKCN